MWRNFFSEKRRVQCKPLISFQLNFPLEIIFSQCNRCFLKTFKFLSNWNRLKHKKIIIINCKTIITCYHTSYLSKTRPQRCPWRSSTFHTKAAIFQWIFLFPSTLRTSSQTEMYMKRELRTWKINLEKEETKRIERKQQIFIACGLSLNIITVYCL